MCGTSQIGNQTRVTTIQNQIKLESGNTEQFNERLNTLIGQRLPSNPGKVLLEGQQKIPVPSALKRRAGACLVGIGVIGRGAVTLLRVGTALGTLGLSEGLYRGGKALCKLIYNKATGRQQISKQHLTFTLPGTNDKTVDLDSSILPSRMPKGMTIKQLTTKIQNKINSGYQLLQGINTDQLTDKRCTVENMTDIMFFLQAKGESMVGNFSQGSFSIPDPDNKIRDFLDTCKEGYQRESSHVNGFQEMTGGKHRGIDAYGSCKHSKTLLPHNMKTLLYGTLAQSKEFQMPGTRLWLKIESHGAWLTSPKGDRDAQGPGRTARWHDAGAMYGHSMSFLATRGKGSLAGSFKERIPSNIKNSFRDLIQNAPENVKNILNKDNPTDKAMGIRVMYRNAVDSLPHIPLDNPELNRDVMNFIVNMENKFSNLDVRIGNEVILTGQDIGLSTTTNDISQGNDAQTIVEAIIQPKIHEILQQNVGGEEKVKQLLNFSDFINDMGLAPDIADQASELLNKELNSLLDTQEIQGSEISETSSFGLPETLDIEDIKQSSSSSVCYILSTLGAVLNTEWGAETLKGLMTDNGSSITVNFGNGSTVTVEKEGLLAPNHPAPPWVQVLEKACTSQLNKDISELGSLFEIPNAFGWQSTEVPEPTELSNISEISREYQHSMLKDLLRTQLTTALNEGKAVTFMRSGHAVALTAIGQTDNFHFHNSLSEDTKETQTLDWIVDKVLNNDGQFCIIEQP